MVSMAEVVEAKAVAAERTGIECEDEDAAE